MNYLFDENCSLKLVVYMRELGEKSVRHVLEVYGAGTLDENMLPVLTKDGYTLVTNDSKMRQQHLVLMLQYNVRALFLPMNWSRYGRWQQSAFILGKWKQIAAEMARMPDALLVSVDHLGHLTDITKQAQSAELKRRPKL